MYIEVRVCFHSNFCYEGRDVYLSSRSDRCLLGLPKLDCDCRARLEMV